MNAFLMSPGACRSLAAFIRPHPSPMDTILMSSGLDQFVQRALLAKIVRRQPDRHPGVRRRPEARWRFDEIDGSAVTSGGKV